MASKKKSAAERIAALLITAPQIASEDEDVDDTRAKVVEGFDSNLSEDETPGRFIKPHIALDDDPRYVGKKASRKNLGYDRTAESASDDGGVGVDADYNEDSNVEGSGEDEEQTSVCGSAGEDYEDSDDDEVEGEDEGESEIEGDEEESEMEGGKEEESEMEGDDNDQNDSMMESKGDIKDSDDNFLHISSKNIASEIEKGKAVRNQLSLWDNLLECRINLQKCLVPANQLPKSDMMKHFRKRGGEAFGNALQDNKAGVSLLLDKLLTLQETLVASFSESKEMIANAKKSSKAETEEEIPSGKEDEEIPSDEEDEEISSDKEDEEIPSDKEDEEISSDKEDEEKHSDTVDEENMPKEIEPAEELPEPKQKRRRLEDYEATIASHHREYSEFRNSVIQKWNERTRIATGKLSNRNFSAFEQTTLQQIQQVLSNKSRLLQRTRLRRAFTNVVGETPTASNTEGEQENGDNDEKKAQLEHDSEIFDDSDFYQQLLRELIERRTGDTQDPAALGRRWATLQKLRSKMKRKVDVRATKGRRLRYDPHQKLVGFMAPVITPNAWSDQAVSELHNSLFGNKKT